MEALITSYGLDFKSLNDLLIKYKAIIAGSSVLSIYLDNVFTANDIDIWIPCNKNISTFLPIYKDLLKYFAKYDYDDDEINKTEVTNERSRYTNLPTGRASIIKVLEFHNSENKRVQFIFIDMNPLIFIKQTFDLSICMTWYNPKTQTIDTFDKKHTKAMEMYINYDKEVKELHPKNQARIEKYISRGFKLIPKPLPILYDRDERIFTKDFKMEASDVVMLGEVNICDYLKESHDHIILKVAQSYYAYKRNELIKELKKFEISESYALTPVKQAIPSCDIEYFKYDDYSIYDIKITTIKTYDKKHTLHKVNPMSVKEFESIYNENGVKDGLIKRYHNVNTLKSETMYVNGKKNGIKKKYDIIGKLIEEIPYVEDKIHGVRKYYKDNEQIFKTVTYDNNKIHGQSVLYFPGTDSIINIKANYVDGKLHGKYTEYNKKGEVVTKVTYENGAIKAPKIII